MKYMKSKDIRRMWLDFFESKGHHVEPGSSLIPKNDPTLLWINAGVAALKKYFDGSEIPPSRRITNAQKILPMSVSAGSEKYPENIPDILSKSSIANICVDAIGKAVELGNQKCLNVVLLGVLAHKLTMIDSKLWVESIKEKVPQKLQELNLKAFEAGWAMA